MGHDTPHWPHALDGWFNWSSSPLGLARIRIYINMYNYKSGGTLWNW